MTNSIQNVFTSKITWQMDIKTAVRYHTTTHPWGHLSQRLWNDCLSYILLGNAKWSGVYVPVCLCGCGCTGGYVCTYRWGYSCCWGACLAGVHVWLGMHLCVEGTNWYWVSPRPFSTLFKKIFYCILIHLVCGHSQLVRVDSLPPPRDPTQVIQSMLRSKHLYPPNHLPGLSPWFLRQGLPLTWSLPIG